MDSRKPVGEQKELIAIRKKAIYLVAAIAFIAWYLFCGAATLPLVLLSSENIVADVIDIADSLIGSCFIFLCYIIIFSILFEYLPKPVSNNVHFHILLFMFGLLFLIPLAQFLFSDQSFSYWIHDLMPPHNLPDRLLIPDPLRLSNIFARTSTVIVNFIHNVTIAKILSSIIFIGGFVQGLEYIYRFIKSLLKSKEE